MFKDGFKTGAGYAMGMFAVSGIGYGILFLGIFAYNKFDEHKKHKEAQKQEQEKKDGE